MLNAARLALDIFCAASDFSESMNSSFLTSLWHKHSLLLYVQPGRCLGWKFSTEKAPLVYVAVIYLNSIFLFNCLPLTPRVVYVNP